MKPKLDQLIDNAIDVLQSAKAGISAKAQAAQQSPEQLEKQKEQLAKIERLLGKVSQ